MLPLQRRTSDLRQTSVSVALLTAALAAAVVAGALIAKQAPQHRYRNGIDATRAVAAARRFMGEDRNARVVWMRSGVLRDFENPGGSTPGHDEDQVWAVSFTGTFVVPCGGPFWSPNVGPCPPATSMIVIVDYHTAHVLYSQLPSPPL